ncbi:hypothetical protein H920_01681 [Fukomys damarensis]|uniref:Uncharacterized protein n=1 Tax=Fukomys damarensis TaxID=885580 RepID=A0A091DXQ9_FUKDA|nr:hypothetical protein H920_01681 [Fukomys damarensis]
MNEWIDQISVVEEKTDIELEILRHQLCKPTLISQLEQEQEPETAERKLHQDPCSDVILLPPANRPQPIRESSERQRVSDRKNRRKQNSMNGVSVRASSVAAYTFTSMRKITAEENLFNETDVGNHSQVTHT